ncbi:PilW family protein [Undibacterium arcticum]
MDYTGAVAADGAPDCYVSDPTTPSTTEITACPSTAATYFAKVTTTAVTNWSNVMAIRVNLLARNNDATGGFIDDKTYKLGLAGDVTPTDKNLQTSCLHPVGASRQSKLTERTMTNNQRQSGATLVVSLIMLVVLTLLVVSAIRFGNTNLRVAGNMQVQTEVAAVAQQAIEQVIDADNPVDFTTTIAAQTIQVSTGPVSYDVHIAKPVCNITVPILSTDPSLNPNDVDDRKCIGDAAGDPPLVLMAIRYRIRRPATSSSGRCRPMFLDGRSGARISQHQGVARRTYIPTAC